MTAEERAFRSRLAQLVHQQPLIRGTINERRVTCGKPGCRCAQGERHRAVYLVCNGPGKRRQLFVPPSLEEEVRRWVANYHTVRDLLERVSERAWQTLEARKG
jgi:hypothetical protein